jgi:hypothetical protein
MPEGHRLRSHDAEGAGRAGPRTPKRQREDPIEPVQFGKCLRPFEDRERLAKGRHLQSEVMPADQKGANLSQHANTERDHHCDPKQNELEVRG